MALLAKDFCLPEVAATFSPEQYTTPSVRGTNVEGRPQDVVDLFKLSPQGLMLYMQCQHVKLNIVTGYTRRDFSGGIEVEPGYVLEKADTVVLVTDDWEKKLKFWEYDIPTRSGWGLAEDGEVYVYCFRPGNYYRGFWCLRGR